MTIPVIPLKIAGGQTFRASHVWFSGDWVYKVITAVTLGWPTQITAASHGIPAGVKVPVWIANARGPKINTTAEVPFLAERVDANTLVLLGLNTGGQSTYVASSATLSYVPPKSLVGWSARGQFRVDPESDVLVDGHSDTGEFVITGATGMLEVVLTEAQSRALLDGGQEILNGICHIELIDTDGEVHRPFDYSWSTTPEGTREA